MTRTTKIDGSTRLTLNNMSGYIEELQQQLMLGHWDIQISVQRPAKGHDMEIAMTPMRNHAALRIANHVYEWPEKKVKKTLLHELLHIILEPLQGEYEHREKEYWGPVTLISPSRFEKHLEQAVEHLTKVIYNQ